MMNRFRLAYADYKNLPSGKKNDVIASFILGHAFVFVIAAWISILFSETLVFALIGIAVAPLVFIFLKVFLEALWFLCMEALDYWKSLGARLDK